MRQVLRQPGAEHQHERQRARRYDPVSWVRAPAASATGVRDELLESGKPWKSPAASVRRPEREKLLILVDALAQLRRVAARQHARVGERDEQRPRSADTVSCPSSPAETLGTVRLGNPWGSGPPPRSRPRGRATATSRVAPATAMNTPGSLRRHPSDATRITTRQLTPIASATGSVWSSASRRARAPPRRSCRRRAGCRAASGS